MSKYIHNSFKSPNNTTIYFHPHWLQPLVWMQCYHRHRSLRTTLWTVACYPYQTRGPDKPFCSLCSVGGRGWQTMLNVPQNARNTMRNEERSKYDINRNIAPRCTHWMPWVIASLWPRNLRRQNSKLLSSCDWLSLSFRMTRCRDMQTWK